MSQCTECHRGTVLPDGYCDYCGVYAPRSSSRRAPPWEPSAVPSAEPDLQPDLQPELEPDLQPELEPELEPAEQRGRTGSARPTPYGPLEMTGVPPVPYRNPRTAELLPEEPMDGLRPGELVSGQYEVRGCLDRGGQGWIYLAHDNNVGHWVVLKGLVDSDDDMSAVPEAERAALAAVNHPNIVKIHNFVRHPVPSRTGGGRTETQSYIVMEYVGGQSLERLLRDRRQIDGPEAVLPVDHVIAYGIEMLQALGYLHARRMLYCDLKPANVMQSGQRLTLIDLGGTWRMDGGATYDPVWGTPGYWAPEVESDGPSIRSDLYTVGRTMAVLSFPFDFAGEFKSGLPPREQVPVLTRFESYDRLLRRATHPDPQQRFADAEEMREQLFGVLREVVSVPRNSESWPLPSTLFGRERRTVGTEIVAVNGAVNGAGSVLGALDPGAAVTALPVPVVSEPDESAAGLADLTLREPDEIIEILTSSQVSSPEAKLVLAGAHLDLGHRAEAGRLLDELAERAERADGAVNAEGAGDAGDTGEPGDADWRIEWYRAVAALAAGDSATAREVFDRLYTRMPGEAAPKLALAFCCEYDGDLTEAAHRYESVWRTDRGYLSAAFGLARVRLDPGDRAGAMRALDEVPSLSRHYGAAQLAAIAVTVRGRPPAELGEEDLLAAAKRLDESRVDGELRSRLEIELLEAALAWVRAGRTARPDARLIGAPLTEKGLRRKLERTYRELARLAKDADGKHALVAKANAVRSRTFI
jgi:serine/threonine-protein kinase PknG